MFFLILVVAQAWAADPVGKVWRPDPDSRIEGLELQTEEVDVLTDITGTQKKDGTYHNQVTVRAQLRGKFKRDYTVLLADGGPVKQDDDGEFEITLPIKDQRREYVFLAVGPKGDVEKERVILEVPAWNAIQEIAGPDTRKVFTQAGAGLTMLNYSRDILTSSISEIALSLNGGMRWLFKPPKWDFTASGVITAYGITGSDTEVIMPEGEGPNVPLTGEKPRFYNLNLRAGYHFDSKSSWRWRMQAGVYLMGVTGGRYGVSLGGPQLCPAFTYLLPKNRMLEGYFKLAVISGKLTPFSSNLDKSLGLAYSFPRDRDPRKRLAITGDLSLIDFSGLVSESEGFAKFSIFSATAGASWYF